MKESVNIIGAGIAGLATAIRLTLRGHRVTVFEQSGRPGGKLDSLEWNGFRWDTGPSLFTLPDLLEELYVIAGEEIKTTLRIRKLEVISRYFYEDATVFNAYGEPELFAEEVQKVFKEPSDRVLKHLDKSRKIYELTSDVFLFRKLFRFGTILSPKFIRALLQAGKLDALSTMNEVNSRRFDSRQLVQLFNSYATYHGSDPFRAPGTLNVISHLMHNLGLYFPERGMFTLADGLRELADKLGVVFHFNHRVENVVMHRRSAMGVITERGLFPSDMVVSGVDAFYLYRDLLDGIPFPVKQFKKEGSTSALIFYWAMNGTFPQLDLHNNLFSSNYREEFRLLGQKSEIYKDPSVYLFISSRLVDGDAPEGKENWYVKIQVPENVGQDWDEWIPRARQTVVKKIKRVLGIDPEPFILKEFVADPRTIEATGYTHRGTLYGPGSNSIRAAFSRHPNFLKTYKGLYFVGGSVHPGGSIPLSLASAKIVDHAINKRS